MKPLIGFSLLLAAGCATVEPLKCYGYKDLGAVKKICRGNPALIDAICPPGRLEDNGSSSKFRERMVRNSDGVGYHTEYAPTRARWCPSMGTIFMAWNEGLEALLHELCHAAMGLPAADCERLFP